MSAIHRRGKKKKMILCKICGNETISYQHPKFNMTFHECKHCEFIFKDQSNYLSLDEELNAYNYHQNDDDNIGYVNFLTNFIDAAVVPYIQKGKALDFGSGPNPVLAKIMRKNYDFDVDIYDIFYAPDRVFENQLYDLITSTEVIEHLSEPMKEIKLLINHLKPNGILSFMTLFHPMNRDKFFDWFYIRDTTHISFYTPKTIEHIAKQFNLEVIYTNDYRYIVLKKQI
jgi:SAM-dependent methyltransferase